MSESAREKASRESREENERVRRARVVAYIQNDLKTRDISEILADIVLYPTAYQNKSSRS